MTKPATSFSFHDLKDLSQGSNYNIIFRFKRRKTKPFSDQEKHFKKLAENMLQDAWTNLNSQEGREIER